MSRDERSEKLYQAVELSTRRTLRRLWISLAILVGGWGMLIAWVN